MQPLTFLRTALLGACVVSGVQVSADELTSFLLEPKEKSTLETISLPSLEQDALAGAVIAGTLDTTAVEQEGDNPVSVQLILKEPHPTDDLYEMDRFRVPDRLDVKTVPIPTGGRAYSWEYR